jgi:hypothetical protein
MRQRRLGVGLLVGVVLMTAACSTPTAPSGDSSGAAGSPASSSAPHASAPISLACNQSQPIDKPSVTTLGVGSEIWQGAAQNLDLKTLNDFSSHGSTFVKSPLTVLPETAQSTTIEVAGPPSAALYYTSWPVWSARQKIGTMISDASSAVIVGGCDGARQFPGGLVVSGPACVTLRILPGGDVNEQATIHVPIGTRCGT